MTVDIRTLPLTELRHDLAECYADALLAFAGLLKGVTMYSGGSVYDRLVRNLEMAECITFEMRARETQAAAHALRPVRVKQSPRSRLPEYDAWFHRWVTAANAAVYAIIEHTDGQVETVDAHLIVFLDREQEVQVDETETQDRA